MDDPPPPNPPELRRAPWWRRKWVTIGEIVGVGALAVAGLNYLDSRRARSAEEVRTVAQTRQEASRETLVLTAQIADEGARLMLRPVRGEQAVQSQRYLFPTAVLDHPMEIVAAPPQIQLAWVRGGLVRELETAAKARGGKVEGSGLLPVGVVTRYVEDGEVRTDHALYQAGYKAAPGGLFGGPHLVLQGLALSRRTGADDLQAAVDARWAAEPKL